MFVSRPGPPHPEGAAVQGAATVVHVVTALTGKQCLGVPG